MPIRTNYNVKFGYDEKSNTIYVLPNYLEDDVIAIHSLLSKKAYRVIWGKEIECSFESGIGFIDGSIKHSLAYSGYLVNHTKKLAIDLADYLNQSKDYGDDGAFGPQGKFFELIEDNIPKEETIDPIPFLTNAEKSVLNKFDIVWEYDKGIEIGIFEELILSNSTGLIPSDMTEGLISQWCGDLLQLMEDVPVEYKVVNCCFAVANRKACYFDQKYGTDEEGYVLNGTSRYEVVRIFTPRGTRIPRPSYVKKNVSKSTGKIHYRCRTIMTEDGQAVRPLYQTIADIYNDDA